MSGPVLARYVAARLFQAALVLVAAYTVTFLVLNTLPGNAVDAITGGQATDITPQQLRSLQVSFGLNRPVWSQWWLHLSQALQGNLGRSYMTGERVTSLLAANFPSTAALAGTALLFALVFGGGLAIWATNTRSGWLKSVLLSLPSLGIAVPSFWLGLMLLQVFSFDAHIFPGTGNDGFKSLVLPALTLAVLPGALIASLLAKSLDAALAQPYSDTARAKGAGPLRVQFGHALRNALTSTVTMSGVLVGQLLAGAVVVETVFSRAGLGELTEQAVSNADIPVVQGMVVLGALAFVSINLLVDLMYPLLDRRVVLGGRSTALL
ncbi:MAG TPA: ABC transporter permease [Acidimicrobiales bacterium]|nr:ABC transporter permease [Acidimicrobiales bacterium]